MFATVLGTAEGTTTLTVTLTSPVNAGGQLHFIYALATPNTATTDNQNAIAVTDSNGNTWPAPQTGEPSLGITGDFSGSVTWLRSAASLGSFCREAVSGDLGIGDTVTATFSSTHPSEFTSLGAVVLLRNVPFDAVGQTNAGWDPGPVYFNGDSDRGTTNILTGPKSIVVPTLSWATDFGDDPKPDDLAYDLTAALAFPPMQTYTPIDTTLVETIIGTNVSLAITERNAIPALTPIDPGGTWSGGLSECYESVVLGESNLVCFLRFNEAASPIADIAVPILGNHPAHFIGSNTTAVASLNNDYQDKAFTIAGSSGGAQITTFDDTFDPASTAAHEYFALEIGFRTPSVLPATNLPLASNADANGGWLLYIDPNQRLLYQFGDGSGTGEGFWITDFTFSPDTTYLVLIKNRSFGVAFSGTVDIYVNGSHIADSTGFGMFSYGNPGVIDRAPAASLPLTFGNEATPLTPAQGSVGVIIDEFSWYLDSLSIVPERHWAVYTETCGARIIAAQYQFMGPAPETPGTNISHRLAF